MKLGIPGIDLTTAGHRQSAAVVRTVEREQPQQRRQQREEGMKLLMLVVTALRDAHKEHGVPYRQAAEAVRYSAAPCKANINPGPSATVANCWSHSSWNTVIAARMLRVALA